MQAVILAAGSGSRLGASANGRHKCLVEFGGRPLILHQLEALADQGVGPILCVVGYQADEVRRVIGDRAETILNERYAETNSLYSLWLARDWIRGPFVLVNSDLLFDPTILESLLEARGSALAYDSTSSRGREQTKVRLSGRRVLDLGKDLPGHATQGESLGILKFDEAGAQALFQAAGHLIAGGAKQAWVIEATRAVCGQLEVEGLNVAGRPWAEIDYPYDLGMARSEVWPAIWRRRWRRLIYWRRTRWALAAVMAVVLAVIGWVASTRVGPARFDWESVPVTGARAVQLERGEGHQRWWLVSTNQLATAQVAGSEAYVEARLLLPDTSRARYRYVVAVLVDGDVQDWEVWTATPDTAVSLAGRLVGDRDRMLLRLGSGVRRIGVRLVEGHGDEMLIRIRDRQDQ